MANIVVAYDGSDASRKGLEKAIALQSEGDEIVLVSILPKAKIQEMSEIDQGEGIGSLREKANDALKDLRRRGIKAMAIIQEGDVVEGILEFAERMDSSMIVIGAGGVSKIGKFALGSVADAVSRQSKRPVLIVR